MNKNTEIDVYQQRYLEYQGGKLDAVGSQHKYTFLETRVILNAINNRKSCRVFKNGRISPYILKRIYDAAEAAPSSCNRKAITIKQIVAREEIAILSNLLVGGARWLQNAEIVLLLFADMRAYKSPNEVDFMPYLDAGVVAENIYLACEALGIGTCFVNPNIRKENKKEFDALFADMRDRRFCGAMALGLHANEEYV